MPCFTYLFLSTFIFFTLSFHASAQSRPARFIFGIESGGSAFTEPKSILPGAWSIRTSPYLNIQVGRRWYFGGNFEHESGQAFGIKTPRILGFGLQGRYYPILPIKDAVLKNRLQFYAAGGVSLLDHAIDGAADFGVRPLNGFSNINVNIYAGMNLRLFSSLYLDIGIGPRLYSKGKTAQFSKTVGLEYHFGEKREPIPQSARPVKQKNNKMKPFDLSYLFSRAIIGTAFTFLWDDPGIGDPLYSKVFIGNINIATALTSDIDVGINVMPIKEISGNISEDYLLYGAFLQYDFLRKYKGLRLFAESGYYRGNFCTCGNGLGYGYKKENLSYVPAGGGFEFPIIRGLYAELGFMAYYITSKVSDEKWAFTQYLIGFNYRFQ